MTKTLLSLLAALVLAAGTLVGLTATTEPGLRWLFAAAARLLPGQLSAAEIHGTLLQPIRIDDLRYVRKGTRVEAKEIELHWRPAALWQRTIDIEALHIRGLQVHYTPAAKRAPAVLPRLALPLRVVVQDLRIDGASLRTQGAKQPLAITQLRLAATLDAQRLAVSRLSVASAQLSLSVSGGLQPRGNYPLDFKLRWQLRPGAAFPPLAGEGTIGGTLEHLTLAQRLSAPGKASVDLTIERPLGALSWQGRADLSPLSVRSLNPAWPAVQIGASLQASGDAERFEGSGDYQARKTPAGPVQGRFRLSGSRSGTIELQQLSAETAGNTPMGLTLSGNAELHTQHFSVQGHWHDLAWPPTGKSAARSPAGAFSAEGTPTAYTLKAKGSLALPSQAPLDWQLAGSGNQHELHIRAARIGLLGGTLRSAGTLGWAGGLRFALNGKWENLSWPSPQQPTLASAQGGYSLQGRPDDYSLKLQASLSGKDIPTGQWALAGQGNQSALQIKELHGQLLDGGVEVKGRVAWAPKPQWALSMEGRGLDPARRWPDWPGSIGLQASTTGTVEAGEAEGSFELARLEGKLRGYPVSASTRITVAGSRYRIETLKLRSGRSTLSASGGIGEQLGVDWSVDSPDLRELLPGARGSVQAGGTVRGTRKAPDITASLTARGPAYAALAAESLKAKLDLALAGDGTFSADVDASGLRYGGRMLGRLMLRSTGKADAHRIEASLQGPGPALSLQAQGGFAQGIWSGRLENSSLAAKPYGEWHQEQPTTLKVSRSAVAAGRACWRRGHARVCLGGDWTRGGKWQAESALTDLPTAWLGQWLALPAELSGTLEARASASGSGDRVAEARAQLTASAGRIVFRPQTKGEPTTLQHGEAQASLHADASRTAAEFKMLLTAPAQSPMQASLSLPPLRLDRSYLREAPMQGSVSATITDLRPLEAFVPDLAELHGAAHVDLQLAGTLRSPRLRGDAGVTGGSAEVPRLGITVKAVSLQAQGDADRIKLSGSATSGPGKLELSGQIGLDPGKGWPVELDLKGERFEAVNIPEAWVLASPDLKLTAAHHAIMLEGEVTIPEAKLHPRQVIAAVPVSSDVVIVSGGKPKAKAPRWQITSRVRVTLGEKVSLEAFGFSGRITGSVLAQDSPGKPTTGTGSLTIKDGTYSAYGQKLQIDGGHVVFAGGPITDPGLDLRAVRKLTDVTAGVRVQGRVSAPQLTLYSDPSMSQDNILSYLILGQPVDQASSTQGQLLARAASSLALQGGNLLSKRIASTFGLSTVSVESNGSPQSASLVIGKYLSPRLYVSYGMGLFQTMNTVRMRYKIGRHWSVEAETGTQMGADVLYSRER